MGRRRPTRPEPPELPDTLYGAFVEAELDLHGMRADAALRRVDGFLESWRRGRPGAVVRIVTGRGHHSEGEPVLLGVVGDLLRDELGGRLEDMVPDSGGGGWVVRVR